MPHNRDYRRISRGRGRTLRTLALLLMLGLLILSACDNDRDPTPTPAPPTQPGRTSQDSQPVAPDGETTEDGADTENGPNTAPASQDDSSNAATDSSASSRPASLSGDITLWHSWAGSEGDALAAVLEEWHAQYPEARVETLFVAATDLPEAYAEAVQNGDGPELVLVQNWWLAEMARAGVAAPLHSADQADNALLPPAAQEAYWPATLGSLRLDGILYGLPLTFQTVGLYVNTSMVDPAAVPATTDAWLQQAAAAPANGIGLYANLFHVAWGFPAYGAQFMDDGGRVVLNQEGDAADFLQWLVMLDRTQGSYVDLDYGMLLDRFKKGEFAYLVDGYWAAPELRGVLGDDLTVAPLPAGPGGAARPWIYAEGVMLNPNLDDTQLNLAWRFAQFLGSPASASLLARQGGLLPAAREADVGDDPILQGFVAQAGTMAAMPVRPEMREAWGYGGDMLLKALTGVTPPPAIISETTTLINEANGK